MKVWQLYEPNIASKKHEGYAINFICSLLSFFDVMSGVKKLAHFHAVITNATLAFITVKAQYISWVLHAFEAME